MRSVREESFRIELTVTVSYLKCKRMRTCRESSKVQVKVAKLETHQNIYHENMYSKMHRHATLQLLGGY